ncbi:MAG: riboflavin synthase [Spirochaetota bacterium]
MFTGLIEEKGVVTGVQKATSGIIISIKASIVTDGTTRGDSISVDGACQTVTATGDGSFSVFASDITCNLTTLGDFKAGRIVNLERAMSASSRFGGHIVQGHVDGKGEIVSVKPDPSGVAISISVAPGLSRYMVAKGSVAVDGISLTIVSIEDNVFTLYLIPETVSETTLPAKKVHDAVNIEVDILAKYVERMLQGSSIKEEEKRDSELARKLMEEGYM